MDALPSTAIAALAADEPPLASLSAVRFRYPQADADSLVVDELVLARGERVFVRGPSGSGKTTLLSLLAGVIVPSQGEARLFGHDWRRLAPAARDRLRADHIGYVFQQFNLLPYLSVIDNVLLPCRFSALRRRRAGAGAGHVRAAAAELLSRMGLDASFGRRSAARLSVGQQQRVAAARALIGAPELVIADEPTSALDEELREAFMKVLLDACAEAGSGLVFVSHDARLAARFERHIDLAAVNRARAPAESGAMR
ncbi:MAG TPA: ABC transporter ATP-binding protein [Caldimonas sp.]|jgi:putative ABC transport system ATP-binding protein|nr:ABC transporter ATP-binding protein [Caldimonas sp.]HEX2540309.1 ABC transporter ATP-binding protein [Caldimonas sp.]